MRCRVVKTELGWEPEFWYAGHSYVNHEGKTVTIPAGWYIEPGFASSSKKEAQAKLDADLEQARISEAADRQYQSQLAYACGERD